jgi:hypothetical protein
VIRAISAGLVLKWLTAFEKTLALLGLPKWPYEVFVGPTFDSPFWEAR